MKVLVISFAYIKKIWICSIKWKPTNSYSYKTSVTCDMFYDTSKKNLNRGH